MGDQLENFIQKNRDHFDDDIQPDQLWQSIEKDLEKPATFSFNNIWKVAAAILLVSTIFLSIDKFSDKKVEYSLNAEFLQAESFYTMLIMEKKDEIASLNVDGLADDFLKEIDDLDAMYQELKKSFERETSDQKVVDAMIANLQLRIQILNKQLSILQQLNERTNESRKNLEV